ncbi:MAG: di-trans,poly-cis-decaprenylcistransferase [Candidatus Firestonebacteria bacterium RIFOXYC2_FULL_39_67]|nr:MAG: di-trans,poly-cis-decaprenylcistransferase [Candidatus Firestonebacteria bacterium RIFOXYD2_FULL_39_29]OGF55226.1 MAG: di-trans,poly-cis-decaprenylcistransferase [Candidatus Firestonebacteria bacterium RifOxyC12_full_39_7]OGF57603.1 MAG: di-trans,poly-cis-decaprenylcistransferase [Candidatus Firestonebacteria bacterium RIFOXYC2_FULL_39_67]
MSNTMKSSSITRDVLKSINKDKLPRHIAIIMDGNGRWAAKKGLPRTAGHKKGMDTVDTIVTTCTNLGIKVLTLYAFSTENWRRPEKEVSFLMRLLKTYLILQRAKLMKNKIRLNVIGRLNELPGFVQKELAKTLKVTKNNTAMTLNLALNYGGRVEIIDAVRKILKDVIAAKGELNPETAINSIDEDTFSNYLYTAGLPDPDLLIRTSGEMRISNFLLWQIAYSEIYVTDILWPDFKEEDLYMSVLNYQHRERRFGGVKSV